MSDKLSKLNSVLVISDHTLAVKVLTSDAFSVINLPEYLLKLEQISDKDFGLLIKLLSHSPFFIEGDSHHRHKKIFTDVFGKTNLTHWLSTFENEIEFATNALDSSSDVDLVDYCFDVLKTLFKPMIGCNVILPDDFEQRLYRFQKVIEPLLSVRELLKQQSELEYLLSSLKHALETPNNYSQNSLLSYLETDIEFSYEDKLMLLLVAYGAKSPLIQTLGNVFLDVLVENRKKYFNNDMFNEELFIKDLDDIIYRSASLLHIYRVATKDFRHENFIVKQGSYVLIRIGNNVSYNSPNDGNALQKGLEFGLGNHYCSGALISRNIISMIVPLFFKKHQSVIVKKWEFDTSIQTAKSLKTLKLNIK